MKIGTRVQVIGDCNDELLGKRIVAIVTMDEDYINGGDQDPNTLESRGWRWACADDDPSEVYYRVLFFVPVIVPGFNIVPGFPDPPDRSDVAKGDVYRAESLRESDGVRGLGR
jgi:hypothetical protein